MSLAGGLRLRLLKTCGLGGLLGAWLLSASAGVLADTAGGLAPEVEINAPSDDAILEGIVVNDTISNIGHTFHRYLSERLQDGEPLQVTLVVHERPSARWGSLIWVEMDGSVLFQRFLAPNTAQLQPLAYGAADQIREAVARHSLEKLFQDNFDIEGDEL